MPPINPTSCHLSCSSVQDTWFIAPEKGNEPAYQALSAISEALRAQKTGLLARFVPRANGEVSLGFIMPFTGESDERACFTMNLMPCEADVRLASFTTFAKKPEVLPSKQQIQTMDNLVDAFMLSEGTFITSSGTRINKWM